MSKLNAIIAIEKGVKSRVYGAVTELHKEAQKTVPFNGFVKTYRKKDDDGEDFPQERVKVQLQAADVLAKLATLQAEAFDVEAAKDFGNCIAKADVVVDGRTLLKDAPATFLLYLEKQLTDIRTFVDKMPVLDEADDWTQDPNSTLFRTQPIQTHKTKKVAKVIVKYEATDKHPAQTEMVNEDVVVGYWDTVKHSGSLPTPRKALIISRIDKFLKAVKVAREEANSVDIASKDVGATMFGYLFE